MVNRNLIRTLEDDVLTTEFNDIFDDENFDLTEALFPPEAEAQEFDLNKIVDGKIIRVDDEVVLVDIAFKSEGTIPRSEWESHEEPPEVGQDIKVLILDLEDDMGRSDQQGGLIQISKKHADHILKWIDLISKIKEGDIVTGTATRKIKGGLLVDIGVPVFLPASQVDIRRPGDIADYIGRVVQCEILKIDEQRRNIVVSRRSLIEKERQYAQKKLLDELEVGQIRKGVVKNIADFGAFVDLGGIDGLLHITDMSSWHAYGHRPSEMVSIDQEIEVMILNIDHEKDQDRPRSSSRMQPSPWLHVSKTEIPRGCDGAKRPGRERDELRGIRQTRTEGIEGLGAHQRNVLDQADHSPERDWFRSATISRSCHPGNRQGQSEQISLGMKQTQDNPWEQG